MKKKNSKQFIIDYLLLILNNFKLINHNLKLMKTYFLISI